MNSFRPAWWLPGPHLQTLGGKLLRSSSARPWRRRRIDTPDGDFLDLDLAGPTGERRGTVLLLHGLEGCSTSGYMLESARLLVERGFRAVALNFRSRGGEPNRLARSYHSGATGDPRHVLELLRREAPGCPLGALGFSLGGNVLLKLLGELEGDGPRLLDAAAAVSVPYDLATAAERMERGLGRLYGAAFLRSLKRALREKVRVRGHDLDLGALDRIRTLREFDDGFTAPLHGFRDASHYYERCSSAAFLEQIRVPTFLLHAEDDPFLPGAAVPVSGLEANPALDVRITPRGGHLGWIAGRNPLRPILWAERRAVERLARSLDPGDEDRPPVRSRAGIPGERHHRRQEGVHGEAEAVVTRADAEETE